jgi:hypothetical protein
MFDMKKQNSSTSKGMISDAAFAIVALTCCCHVRCLVSADYLNLQPKEDLEHVDCTQTCTGLMTRPIATVVFQVLLLQLNSCSVAECSSHCSRI